MTALPCCRTYKSYTHARVVVVVPPASLVKRNVLKRARLWIKTQRGSGKQNFPKKEKNALPGGVCVVDQSRATLFFFFSPPLSHLSSASPSAGVSNIEIRKITMHGKKKKCTRQQGIKLAQKRMHKILTHLRCRELADDDRPARNHYRLP